MPKYVCPICGTVWRASDEGDLVESDGIWVHRENPVDPPDRRGCPECRPDTDQGRWVFLSTA